MILHEDLVILVDEADVATGIMEKAIAHRQGLLHRAFSVLLFNEKNELLLQQRAEGKYHCGGLWTNTCCSHPRPGEDVLSAAQRRLREEMGIVTFLQKAFDFIYRARVGNGLTEHEFDHVFVGWFNGMPVINKDEVADWKFISLEDVKKDMMQHSEAYTPWFKLIIEKLSFTKLI